jgi:hypothetical protein
MGLALETIVGYNGNLTGSTTYDALTAGTGDTFTVRSYVDGSAAYLEDIWGADDDSAFTLSIKSPRMHDNVYGLRLAGTNLSVAVEQAFLPQPLLPGHVIQKLYSTDVLSVTANGTAADIVCFAFNVRYENLGGISARLFRWEQLRPHIRNMVGINTAPVPSGTAGNWGANYLLNAGDNRLKANTDYCVLGYTCSRTVVAVAMTGIDTGNLAIGGPGGPDSRTTGDFFVQNDVFYGLPHVPVINSNNAGGINVQVADILTSGTPNVTWIMGELDQLMGNPAPV